MSGQPSAANGVPPGVRMARTLIRRWDHFGSLVFDSTHRMLISASHANTVRPWERGWGRLRLSLGGYSFSEKDFGN
jgi:hypothetical protein